MSDTPRTDKAETSALWMINFRRVTAEFARELERENAALREKIKLVARATLSEGNRENLVRRILSVLNKEAKP